MDDQGEWWYDRQTTVGKTTDPFSNADMISPHFGWSAAESLGSRAVMTSITLLCCRQQVTVWLDKHFNQKSQVMATLEVAKFGPGTGALEAARFNMAVSTSLHTGLAMLSAVEASKAPTTLASGVTGVMDQ